MKINLNEGSTVLLHSHRRGLSPTVKCQYKTCRRSNCKNVPLVVLIQEQVCVQGIINSTEVRVKDLTELITKRTISRLHAYTLVYCSHLASYIYLYLSKVKYCTYLTDIIKLRLVSVVTCYYRRLLITCPGYIGSPLKSMELDCNNFYHPYYACKRMARKFRVDPVYCTQYYI